MSINLHLPSKTETLRPTITVIGVGGAGGNAVNNMVSAKLEGVNFVVANTDAQALDHALTQKRIQLGSDSTRGLGAGADPTVGRNAADEAMDDIAEAIEGSNMVFITAGMGGGTGTGAAPVVAKLAREQGILTVGVVTKPFHFEGTHRMRLAEQGLQELQQYVDTLIVIPNQNLFRIANEKTTFADAFRMADEVLHTGVRGLTDLIVKPGIVNLDFADIRTVMREMGKAMMGTGEATGERRALDAAEAAISNPLLDDVSLKGAKAVLINITGGMDMGLYEVDEAANRIREEVDADANIIFGSAFSESMDGKIRVSVVATGIDAENVRAGAGMSSAERKPYTVSAAARQEARVMPKPQLIITTPPATKAPAMTDFTASQPQGETSRPLQQNEFGFGSGMTEEASRAAEYAEPSPFAGHPAYGNASPEAPRVPPQPAASPFPGPQLFSAPSHSASDMTHQDSPYRSSPQRAVPPREESAGGFFQKFAGFGKAMAKPYHDGAEPKAQDARSMQVSERPREQAADKLAAASAEEDYLDIPAFLRRQAN